MYTPSWAGTVTNPHEPVLLQLLPENELKQAINFMEDLKGNHKSEVMKLLSNIDDSNSGLSKDMLTKRLLGNSIYFTEYEIREFSAIL